MSRSCKSCGKPTSHHLLNDTYTYEEQSNEFENFKLIYLPLRSQWYSPSECLWTDETGLPGKAAIKLYYVHQHKFFLQKLGVKRPDLQLYIKELKIYCTGATEPEEITIKSLIGAINACRPAAGEVSGLKDLIFLPIVDVDGKIRLKSPSDTFAIIDRREHRSIFLGKVAFLDYDIEEVHSLRSLVIALGLQNRYTSVMATEETSAEDSSQSAILTDRFRERAYALFR